MEITMATVKNFAELISFLVKFRIRFSASESAEGFFTIIIHDNPK